MRKLRLALVAAIFAIMTLVAAAPAQASKCNQYPYFIQPLLCRL